MPVSQSDSPESVAEKVFDLECQLYPKAVKLFEEDKISIIDNKIFIKG